MPLAAAVNLSISPDGHEAGSLAASRALARLAGQPITLAWVLATQNYDLTKVKSGVSNVLGHQVPLLGFSTSGILAERDRHSRAVAVAVLGGRHLPIQADWWPDPGDDPENLARLLEISRDAAGSPEASLFVIGDGFNGAADMFCRLPLDPSINLAGGLAGGSLRTGRTYQIGGRNSGSGGLVVAWLPEQLQMSAALGCGWSPMGENLRVDRVEGLWVRELNACRPSELLAELFGFPARQWAYPPLSESVRQYPLELDLEDGLLVRSPLRVEADGSLRMNAAIPEGYSGRLMVGNSPDCLQAAALAAQRALVGLRGARPVFGLLMVDKAWQGLLNARPGAEIAAVQKTLGEDLPLLGGYGFGQIGRELPSGALQLFNQQLEVILFGAY